VHQINFFEKGAGFPIVCLHGFCESNMIWKGLSEQLADQFRIICPDLPGFGKSKAPENGFSLKEIGTTIVQMAARPGHTTMYHSRALPGRLHSP
jgi:pimeloyl-ACP methyl ester carboxylesterase